LTYLTITATRLNAVTLLVFVLILASSASGQDRSPLLGTWSLDFTESTFVSDPPQYIRVTCKIEPWEQDGLKVIYDMVGNRGGVTHWEWMGKLDGHDYPLEGVDEFITNAYSQAGDRTYSLVFKVDGRVSTTSRITVSPDGKTMTVTSGSNTVIYKSGSGGRIQRK
jgi:hypothetical protein